LDRHRVRRRYGVVLALAAVLLVVGRGDAGGERNGALGLRTLASSHGRAIGTAVEARALGHSAGYRAELAREFSSVTPENAMKWEVTEPHRGRFDFSDADRIVDFARAHDMRVRGHVLVWHEQNPGWLARGHFSRAELIAILRDHILRVVGRYRGRVASWDVVNEAVGDDGGLRPSLWLKRIGPEYIPLAFRFAHEADPAATLFYNEIGAEGLGGKSDTVYALLKALRERGIPVGGVGFQGHFTLDGPPPTFRKNMERFAALGLRIAISEADVRVRLPASIDELRVQGDVFGTTLADCLAVSACRSFTVWGFTDRYSWVADNQPGYGAATVSDHELNPKPAYRAVQELLARR
jgi:endo-1,4-beta-xylanase